MTLIQALNDPALRRIIDAIEDIHASLDGREDDPMLQDCLETACADLERRTGLNLR
jgi:hypothetical protein